MVPPDTPDHDFMVVGIGASAGGLKALTELFEHVPEHIGMAFVVIVHLSPEHESRLPHLLQQATTMPVRPVTEAIDIQPDHVYVISPNSQLRMDAGRLEPAEALERRGARMTIDVFLETLANAHKQRSVGIVLSGTGFDGTLGVRAIKASGGITMAQTPEEAEYDSMPRNAIASGVIDFVLPAREMADKIESVWRNAKGIWLPTPPDRSTPEDEAAEADAAIHEILATLHTRTRHDFSQYKRATLLRRIERRLQVNQLKNLRQYRDFIVEDENEAQALLRDLLISVTWFFRDPAAWQMVEQRVIPQLLNGQNGGTIRVWVVGCATGEEVYTLAMLLQERLQTMTSPPKVNIFATDIDEEALAFARAGVYPESIAEHMTHERLGRFFMRDQGSYRVHKQLREMIVFAVHNVIQDPPFSHLNLVSCRNLLIYLNRQVQSKVINLLHFSLKADGYLFLGMSETIEDGHDGFVVLDKACRIFAQQPRGRIGLTLSSFPTTQPHRSAGDPSGRRMVSFAELHQRLLEHYAPPSIVVDDRYDIIHLSDRAGLFLKLGPGDASLNLLRAMPEEVRFALKATLDQAMQTMRTSEHIGLVLHRNQQSYPLNVKVHPVRERASARTFALVIFDESAADGEILAKVTNEPIVASSSETIVLEDRLRAMELQLSAAIEQYEVQNEELKASNEELQATNEELRAAGEELETGKEELQSINEELLTVNQELKNKVDETTRLSDDLQNFVTATEMAAIFVDREMRLMRYTPFAPDIFNVIPSDIGRPLSDITHRLGGFDFVGAVNRVFETLHVLEYEAESSDHRWYIIRLLPYRTIDDRIRGAVLTFVDITQRKQAEAIGRRTQTWSKLVVENLRGYAIVTVDRAGKIRSWNPGASHIFGYDANEAIGKDAAILFTPEDRAAGVPEAEMAQARQTGRADDERWQLRRDGSRFFASGIMACIDEDGEAGFVKVLRDMTEQKLAEDHQNQLLAAERVNRSAAEEANRLKDEFLAMLSHELRNPLALMLMQAEILLRAPEAKKSERLQQSGRIIHEMVRAQAQLVEDMLDVSRAKTGKLMIDRQLLPLTFLIADSIGALRREAERKHVTLEVHIGEAPLIVEADPIRVRQIAWNLLSNALKFTPSGGTVRVRLIGEGEYARLDVEDTGQGIAPDELPHIFEWFHRRDKVAPTQSGMGIGLALVRQLVELHDGRLEAHSDGPGKGARFTVWLPLQQKATVAKRGRASVVGDGPELAGLRILVVDDSIANGQALQDLLEMEGAHVHIESSSRSAVERATKDRFDVLVSDIAMPEFDGFAMLKKIRESPANAATPAIAYSGYSGATEVNRARKAGFDAHLTKPVDVQTLLKTISTIAKRSKAADD